MAALSEESKETVHFVERAGTNIRYIDKITPSANMFATGSHVGLEFPLAGTAVGKAILSELSEAEVKAEWDDSQIVQYTPNTICDLDRLLEELKTPGKPGLPMIWKKGKPDCSAWESACRIIRAIMSTESVFPPRWQGCRRNAWRK